MSKENVEINAIIDMMQEAKERMEKLRQEEKKQQEEKKKEKNLCNFCNNPVTKRHVKFTNIEHNPNILLFCNKGCKRQWIYKKQKDKLSSI